MKKALFTTSIIFLITFFYSTQEGNAQTIVNGSFESAKGYPYKTHLKLYPGREIVYGWKVFREVDYVGKLWEHAYGNYSIDLNGNSAGSIGQIIETIPGYTYSIQFDVSANPNCDSEPKYVTVSAADKETTYTVFMDDISNEEMKWRTKFFSFRATASQSLLLFISMSPGNCGVTLDNVRFTPIAQLPFFSKKEFESISK